MSYLQYTIPEVFPDGPSIIVEPATIPDTPREQMLEPHECCMCHHEHEQRTLIEPPDGDGLLCPECANEHTCECSQCNEIHWSEDVSECYRGDNCRARLVCSDCSWECDGCGDRFYGDSSGLSGTYCQACFDEEYCHCSDCSCEISTEDAYHTDDGNGPYCERCFERHDDSEQSELVYDYSHRPRAKFHSAGAVHHFNPY